MTPFITEPRKPKPSGLLWISAACLVAGITVTAATVKFAPPLPGAANAAPMAGMAPPQGAFVQTAPTQGGQAGAAPGAQVATAPLPPATRLDHNPAQAPLTPGPMPSAKLPLLPPLVTQDPNQPARIRQRVPAPKGSLSPSKGTQSAPEGPLETLQKIKAQAKPFVNPPHGQPGHVHSPGESLEQATLTTQTPAKKKKKVVLSACVKQLKRLAGRARVLFSPSSAQVDLKSQEIVALMARYLNNCPEAQVRIVGYTDPAGDPDQNLKLSWKRAYNVADILYVGGVNPDQVTATSHMENHPDHCEHFELVDRRVEFLISQVAPSRG